MRAKEKLEFNRKEFDYYVHVRKSIYDLYPLRTDKRKTRDYFNEHLFADARYRMEIKSSSGTYNTAKFRENKSEIDHSIAYRVRQEMKNAINEDLTFLYAYNIIERDHNPYDGDQKGNAVNLKPETLLSSVEIEEECIKYKEDYPKNNLADFLLDADNLNFYLAQCREMPADDELWLDAFNHAYELFDKIRVKAFDPFKAQYMVKNIFCDDELLEQTIVKIVHNLLINYSYDLSSEQKIKFALLTDKIEEYWDDKYYIIDDKHIKDFDTLNPDEVDWKKTTKYFNYQIINHCVTQPTFNGDQQLRIFNSIETMYLNEKQEHPFFYHCDLSIFFDKLRQQLQNNILPYPDPPDQSTPPNTTKQTTTEQNTVIDDLKIYIEQLNEIIRQKDEELRLLSEKHDAEIEKHDAEIENMKSFLNEHAEIYNHKGLTLAQQVLVFYYLFNELDVNFSNSLKVQWARFLEKATGKHIQNIRAELNIDFESKKTKKNLKIVADLFRELLPKITTKIENDSK